MENVSSGAIKWSQQCVVLLPRENDWHSISQFCQMLVRYGWNGRHHLRTVNPFSGMPRAVTSTLAGSRMKDSPPECYERDIRWREQSANGNKIIQAFSFTKAGFPLHVQCSMSIEHWTLNIRCSRVRSVSTAMRNAQMFDAPWMRCHGKRTAYGVFAYSRCESVCTVSRSSLESDSAIMHEPNRNDALRDAIVRVCCAVSIRL